jgi:hypothetical protein
VIDGWASAAHGNRQVVVRASRALRPRYDELAVGPIRLSIVEPMQRVHLTVEDNPSGIELDVELTSQSPPFAEDRYQHVKFGAVITDTIRYTTVCRAGGRGRAMGHELTIDGWHAMRDHSWGIRSSMGVPTRLSGTDRTDEETFDRALRLWVPFEAGDHTGFINTHEDPDGRPLDFEGRLDWPDGRSVALTGMSHELTYRPGTQWPTGGTLVLDAADGVARKYELRLAGTPADVQAGGLLPRLARRPRPWHLPRRRGAGDRRLRRDTGRRADGPAARARTPPARAHRVPHAHGRPGRRGRDGALRTQHPRRVPPVRIGLGAGGTATTGLAG